MDGWLKTSDLVNRPATTSGCHCGSVNFRSLSEQHAVACARCGLVYSTGYWVERPVVSLKEEPKEKA